METLMEKQVSNPYSLESVLKILKDELSKIMDLSLDEISSVSTLDDFGADSLDYLHFVNRIEKRLKVDFPQKNILEYVSEKGIPEEKYYNEKGLTRDGVDLLKNSLNKFSDEQLEVGMLIESIYFIATLENWANICVSIFESLPTNCHACGAIQKNIDDDGNIKCMNCEQIFRPLSGDEVLEKHLEKIL